MTSIKFGRRKKIKLKRDKTSILATVAVVLFIASLGVHFLFGSHAATPDTPTLNDACGVVSPSDIEEPTTPIVTQSSAISPAISNLTGNYQTYQLFDNNGTEEAYVMSSGGSSQQITIYNLNTGA